MTATSAAVDRLAALQGVRLAVAAGAHEGLVVHAAGQDTRDAEAVAALFASLARRAIEVAALEGRGEPRLLRLDAGNAEVLLTVAGDVVLIAVALPGANVGRIRLELLQSGEALR